MKSRINNKAPKMALIGTQRVGKTSLLNKLHFGTFEKNTIATVGASFILQQFLINDIEISFQIWDTAGQERYRSLGPIYYRDASCAIAVFDLTSITSFEEMKIYIEQFKINCIEINHIAIIGNKLDLFKNEGGVDILLIEKWSKNEGYSFFKVSAATGEGIIDSFQSIAEIVYNFYSKNKNSNNLIKQIEKNNSCC